MGFEGVNVGLEMALGALEKVCMGFILIQS